MTVAAPVAVGSCGDAAAVAPADCSPAVRSGSTTRWLASMRPRDPTDRDRQVTPLELFVDLCFVVAVAQAADGLHYAVAAGDVVTGVVAYSTVFFAVWWAWMNVTWFASAYDNDDVAFRAATLVQIVGVLVLAAGVHRVFHAGDHSVVTLGYLVMRVALVAQWVRASRGDPARRVTCLRQAVGITAAMLGWGLLLTLPGSLRLPAFVGMALVELSIPVWAQRASEPTWHPGHIAERYALFTIIVLGETVLAATVALRRVVDDTDRLTHLGGLMIGTTFVVFGMWWTYFSGEGQARPFTDGSVYIWGYGHFPLFAVTAAVGAGVVVNVDVAGGDAEASSLVAALSVTAPAASYLVLVWLLRRAGTPTSPHRRDGLHLPAAAVLVLAATWTAEPVLLAGLVYVLLVVADTAVAVAGDRAGDGHARSGCRRGE